MPLKLKPITSPSYHATLAHVKHLAFKSNPLQAALYPVHDDETMETWFQQREENDDSFTSQETIAVFDTDTDSIVAWIKFRKPLPKEDKEPEELSGQAGRNRLRNAQIVPVGTRMDLKEVFASAHGGMMSKYLDLERDYSISTLATHPDHRGRGCASLLLQYITALADADGSRIFVGSTPAAKSLYGHYGWEMVDEISTDLSEFGGVGSHVLSIMIRKPKAKNT